MRAVAPLAALLACACSAIVTPASGPIPCVLRTDGSDPCTSLSQRCVEGACRPCLSSEVCNELDDDCDGTIDEGVDLDGDGFGCGADCNDSDAMVNPGVSLDVCNGIDDDCDGCVDAQDGTPECGNNFDRCPGGLVCIPRFAERCVTANCTYPESPGCMMGFVCDPMTGGCVPGDDCTLTGCLAGQLCDEITRRCVTPQPLGEPCNTDAECESGRCYLAREALTLASAITTGANGICGRACCSDNDCPSGFACWAPGTGARSCVSRAVLAAGPQGDLRARPCQDEATCGADQCVAATTVVYDRTQLAGNFCGAGPTGSDASACYASSECRSGVCLLAFRTFFGDRFGPCTGACRTSADCTRFSNRFNASIESIGSGEIRMQCSYGRFADSTDWIPLCLIADGGQRAAGADCSANTDCLDEACVGGRCRATCCADSDCNGGDHCRPIAINGRWEMHCMAPTTSR